MDANERESGLRLGEWGEKEGLNGSVPSALELGFRTSFA